MSGSQNPPLPFRSRKLKEEKQKTREEYVLPPLKTSTIAKSGYWKVTTQASYKGKFKAFKPGHGGRMITTEEGGGLFDSAKDAAVALRKWCIDNGVKY
tara:strand:+ start:364 stop:657 length:294 start_codon:yes stop_codon:yes gene_type:complete